MSGWLVVFGKAPRPGRVKTRFSPPLTPEQAATLYASLLADTLEESARAAREHALEAVLAVDPPQAVSELARQTPAGFRVVAQRGPDLGRRMARAVREAAAGGARPILLRGSDSPALDAATIAQALGELERADVVLCPDRDGGYNLVGLNDPAPGLFDHPMSTATVLEDTLANAARLGLHASVLPAGFDLDTVEDLAWLAGERRENAALPCPRTLACLDALDLWRSAPHSR